ncbi:DUF1714 domain-containing protein [Ascosphaera apis ARSEF 7405]|uniref:histone acetyltransferase n=1 Tax=Ascosphaera apis ARSEF 7405 TaxID=392613 RepID=A0A162IJA9_9EURO|nr:DUF1714 domain-containing protein [Ascosphaera apis ARSEF 7405]
MGASTLATQLAEALPKGTSLVVRHIKTASATCEPLFAHPPGCEDEKTTCERHFLLVSVPSQPKKGDNGNGNDAASEEGELFAFAIEVYVYTTDSLTVIFVSKADSTGYLQRACSASGAKPNVRALSTAFLSHIIELSQVPGKRLIASLFARSQNQYIFPGSATNGDKHILDDRALVKWWCRVLDPILRTFEPETHGDGAGIVQQATASTSKSEQEMTKASATAYLIVPGCDKFETRNFFPPLARSDPASATRWKNLYPLYQVCQDPAAPPRCLVPRFPDDPKARYLEELDSELSASTSQLQGAEQSNTTFEWRSVKTLDQFWELMAFRQECSSGRLVGFLWMVINPPGMVNDASSAKCESTPSVSDESKQNAAISAIEQGEFVLSSKDYLKLIRNLEDQDFGDVKISIESTQQVIKELSDISGREASGAFITGLATSTDNSTKRTAPVVSGVSDLTGLIKKRKATSIEPAKPPSDNFIPVNSADSNPQETEEKAVEPPKPVVNVLNSSFIRKKKKTG